MKNQRALTTKRLLRNGLLQLLEEKKLEKITVTELCQASGINRVTFYNHYSEPRGILLDLEECMVKEMQSLYEPPITQESFLPCLESICTYLHDHAKVAKVLIQYNTDTELTNFMNEISRRFHAVNEQLQTINALDADNARLATTFLGSGSYFLLAQWIVEDIQKTPKEIARLIYALIYNA